MRLGVLALSLLLASATADAQRNRRNETDAVQRACSVTDCFNERDIRQFEVIDRTHIIVYTGPQRCPFHVEVQGTFCDLTFAPELIFSRGRDMQGRLIVGPNQPTPDPLGRGSEFDPLSRIEPGRRDMRVCANDIGIQVFGGQFTESVARGGAAQSAPDLSTLRTDCRITGVTAITDDQLLEFLIARGVLAPPPPMGTAEIEVGEQPAEQGSSDSAEAPAAQSD